MDTKGLQKEFINWCKANKKSPKSELETKLLFVSFMKEKHPEEYKAAVENLKKQQLQQAQKAAHGAKLNYFKSLKNQCAEDEEIVYYKKGGSVTCGCKKKEDGGEVRKAGLGCSAIDKFRMARKASSGMEVPEDKKKKKVTEGLIRTIPVSRKQVEAAKKNNEELRKGTSKLPQDNAVNDKVETKTDKKKVPVKCGGSAIKAFKMHRLGGRITFSI